MKKEKSFIYVIKFEIGPRIFSVMVRNSQKVPSDLLNNMAKTIIEKSINDSYFQLKEYRHETSEHFFNKMLKQSSYEIDDLNEIEVIDLGLKFDSSNNIINIVRTEEDNERNREKAARARKSGKRSRKEILAQERLSDTGRLDVKEQDSNQQPQS